MEATGLVVSVGVSGTKYVAKVASDFGKPDGLVVVRRRTRNPGSRHCRLSRLWGAGAKTQQRLIALGFNDHRRHRRRSTGVSRRAAGRRGPALLRARARRRSARSRRLATFEEHGLGSNARARRTSARRHRVVPAPLGGRRRATAAPARLCGVRRSRQAEDGRFPTADAAAAPAARDRRRCDSARAQH